MTWQPRPISDDELPHLEAMGKALAALRHQAGITQRELALRAGLSRRHIEQLERGQVRTRRRTLGYIASALVNSCPDLGDSDSLADQLATLAGPALAAESAYVDRVVKRRERRLRKAKSSEARSARKALSAVAVDLAAARSLSALEDAAEAMSKTITEQRADT